MHLTQVSIDDIQALKTTKVDLDIAKTIALAAKSNLKRRMILLKSTTRHSNHAEIAMVIQFNPTFYMYAHILHIIVGRKDQEERGNVENVCS